MGLWERLKSNIAQPNRFIKPYPHPGKAKAVAGTDADNALKRLIKYIPGDVIAGYVMLSNLVELIPADDALRPSAGLGSFLLCAVLTPFYLAAADPETDPAVRRQIHWWQYAISTVAFVLWAYTLGGYFKMGDPVLGGYRPWLGPLAGMGFTLVVALVWKPKEPK
jgi:hypothetical protein